jgi:hypothetical protein
VSESVLPFRGRRWISGSRLLRLLPRTQAWLGFFHWTCCFEGVYYKVNTACSLGTEYRECRSTVSEPEPARAPTNIAASLPLKLLSMSLLPANARLRKSAAARESPSTPRPHIWLLGCSPPLPTIVPPTVHRTIRPHSSLSVSSYIIPSIILFCFIF